MKLLIIGSSGLLGLNLALDAMSTYDVTGVDRGKLVKPPFNNIKANLLEADSVEYILKEAQPEWVINCAAMADLEVCEEKPELALQMNAQFPEKLAVACAQKNIRLVHISTDAVFDGTKGGYYTEEDEPNPINVYARTKLAGEQAVLRSNKEALVARVNFYGWSLSGRRSLAEFFFNNLTNNKSMSGFTDVLFCPTFVNDTGRLLLKMLEKKLTGLYNVVGEQTMSKYQFGVEVARKFNLKEGEISPKSVLSSSLTARRANNLSLSTSKLSTGLGEPIPSFSTGMNEFYAQFQQGYPQKIRGYQHG